MDYMTVNVSTAAVRVDGLSRRYGTIRALDGVDLTLERGITGLLGPNGAGKTTLLSILATVSEPDAGRVSVLGLDPKHGAERVEIRRRLGYLPQEPSVFRRMSVSSNIMAILETRPGLDEAKRRARLTELMDELHIGHVRESLGMSLSGGERRRVEIARLLLIVVPAM